MTQPRRWINRKPINPFAQTPHNTSEPVRVEKLPARQQGRLTQNPFQKAHKNEIEEKIGEIMDNPLTQMGIDYTNSTINKIYEDNRGVLLNTLFNKKTKSYFDIEQEVVFNKLKLMLFPFNSLRTKEDDMGDKPTGYVTVAEFYLPFMALVSFVLISSFKIILNNQEFDSSKIVSSVSSCLLMSFCESLLVKVAFITATGVSLPVLDVIGFLCYKYVG